MRKYRHDDDAWDVWEHCCANTPLTCTSVHGVRVCSCVCTVAERPTGGCAEHEGAAHNDRIPNLVRGTITAGKRQPMIMTTSNATVAARAAAADWAECFMSKFPALGKCARRLNESGKLFGLNERKTNECRLFSLGLGAAVATARGRIDVVVLYMFAMYITHLCN